MFVFFAVAALCNDFYEEYAYEPEANEAIDYYAPAVEASEVDEVIEEYNKPHYDYEAVDEQPEYINVYAPAVEYYEPTEEVEEYNQPHYDIEDESTGIDYYAEAIESNEAGEYNQPHYDDETDGEVHDFGGDADE